MLCYRDRQYCETNGCGDPSCDRLLTDDVREQARTWLGKDGAPIAIGPCRAKAQPTGAPNAR